MKKNNDIKKAPPPKEYIERMTDNSIGFTVLSTEKQRNKDKNKGSSK